MSGSSLLTLDPCRQPRWEIQRVPVPIQSKPITGGGGREKGRTFPQSPQRSLLRGSLEPLIPYCRDSVGAPPSPHFTSMAPHLGVVVQELCESEIEPLKQFLLCPPRRSGRASISPERSAVVPAVARSRVLQASPSPSPPEPAAAAPPAGRGTRGQHTPFCYPTGAHVGQPGASPARLSRSRLGAADPSDRCPPVSPGCPGPRGACGLGLEGRSPRAAPRSSFPASGRPSAPGLLQRFPIF